MKPARVQMQRRWISFCACVHTSWWRERGAHWKTRSQASLMPWVLGPSVPTEYIYCAYSNVTLQNDLHFELFEEQWYSSRWLEAIAQQVLWKRWYFWSSLCIKGGETAEETLHRDTASWFWNRQGFFKIIIIKVMYYICIMPCNCQWQ